MYLGISSAEFQSSYDALLMVPRWYYADVGIDSAMEIGRLSMLLMQKMSDKDWQQITEQTIENASEAFALPEACLVDLDFEAGHFNLSVVTVVDLFAEPVGTPISDNTFLSMHKPFVRVPIVSAPWDPVMYDDPDPDNGSTAYERWPFLPEDRDWVTLRKDDEEK